MVISINQCDILLRLSLFQFLQNILSITFCIKYNDICGMLKYLHSLKGKNRHKYH